MRRDMGGTPSSPDDRDAVEGALDDLRRSYAAGRPPSTLDARIVEAVRRTPQAPSPRMRLPIDPGHRLTLAWTAVAAAVAVVVLGAGLVVWGPHPTTGQLASLPAGGGASSPSGHASPAATSAQAPPSAAAVGTCPVTAITRVVGATAPEVDASGLQWRWGGVPWVAGQPEKVVWLEDTGRPSAWDLRVFAVRLDRSIPAGNEAVTYPALGGRSILAAGEGSAQGVVLPDPGCWMLTAVWSGGASSVVVAVSPATPVPGGPTSATPAAIPSSAVPAGPPASCPASTRSPDSAPRGWPGPAYADGDFRWLTPTAAAWKIGADGDKLVLDSAAGWDVGRMVIEALPILGPSPVGWLDRTAVDGDIPPGFGGGTLGFGLALPSRGCWAIVYAGSQATSTIVVDLGR
ncbi:MAG TPA: hypothetical protein VF802_04175 [Candidatus Limnocylindrales bacterium]